LRDWHVPNDRSTDNASACGGDGTNRSTWRAGLRGEGLPYPAVAGMEETAEPIPAWLHATPRSFTCDDMGLDELILDDPSWILGVDPAVSPIKAQEHYSGPGTQMCPVQEFEPMYTGRLPLEPPQEVGDEIAGSHGHNSSNSAVPNEQFGLRSHSANMSL